MTSAFTTMADVRDANAAIDHHFFEPGTLRFFASRVLGELISGAFFVTSEQRHAPFCDKSHGARGQERTPGGGAVGSGCDTRRYTIRKVYPRGAIGTVGEFQQYATAKAAKAEARELDYAAEIMGEESDDE